MAMLTSGEYTLIKKKSVFEEKSMLFVKLTDSALRALDNYMKNMNKCDSPVIEFDNDEGRLLIPTFQKDASDPEKLAQFKFNVTSNEIMQGRQGRLECIQHRKGTKQLVKLGQLTRRLRVHANEDVYETTKKRMAAIEQEQRKNCTVLLDRNSPQMNRRSRLDRLPKPNPTTTLLPSLPKAASVTPPPPSSQAAAASSEDSKIISVPETNMVRNKGRPVTSSLPSKLNAASIIRKPLKDRIIHLLALRPLNKLQLISALDKDGIRKCDKTNLSEILSAVATLRDNVYHLSKHAWNDVQEDWYFYTDLEKQQIKRAKSCNLTSPCGSDSGISITSNHSPNPASAPSLDKSPSSSYKRPGYFNGVDGFQTKRQRISHFVKPEPSSASAVKPEENAHSRNNACFDELNVAKSAPDRPSKPSMHTKYSPDSPDSSDSKPNSDQPPRKPYSIFQFSPDSPQDPEHSKPIPSVVVTSPQPAPDRNGDSSASSLDHREHPQSFYSPPKAVPDSHPAPPENKCQKPKPKYMKEYVTIKTMEQRRRYKSDFNTIFKEYKRVHEEIDTISNKFAQLGESLRQHKKGTRKYAEIEQEILQNYKDFKSSKKFQAAKLRFEYLHEKLSHIKNLVHEYDVKYLNN